ncbi:uncharacterized protein BX663DRAFT_438704 [Cokeromyces recurvatus]|uniref:uncharacterized protein n=1 Tax=Cokeromyces recurvatus TaxID=90255 RepID=UPI00221E9843|nr:uncharacterized protein BX663DRAFT_438704 [Cokeromyces recurvatus]KAI7900860.1 hypothetical protein BX663DRAFT_438704 [Cokeromyces recurvatus]
MNHEYHQQEYHYQFKVIEHQRWWLFKGWCSLLLKNERPSWSDEYLERVPCIQKFRLPSPVTKIIDNEKIMINSWEWSSQEWRIDKQRNVDKEGWEYGVWGWNAWISRPSSFCSFTRRRYWVRNACLVTKINNDHYVTTMENGSIKPSSTNYINTQMTPSNPNSINANKYNQQLRPSSSQSTVTSTNNVPSLSSASLSNTASSSEEEEEEEEIGILLMTPTTVTVSTSQFDYKKSFVHHHHQKLSTPLTTSNKSTQSNRIKRSASRNSAIENHFWLYR